MKAKIRKLVTLVEETRREMDRDGRAADPPRRGGGGDREPICRALCGRSLGPLIDIGEELGALLGRARRRGARHRGRAVESYGKAAAVGENGELEHAAAILHPKLGAPVREALGKGAALIPSSKKTRRAGRAARHPARPQGRRLRPQPFRRHGGADQRCAARRRDRGRRRGHRQRPPPAARRRAAPRSRSRARMDCAERAATLPLPRGVEHAYRLEEQVGFLLRRATQRHVAIFAARMGED